MSTQIVMMRKKSRAEEEELKKNHMKYIMKHCSSLSMKHHHHSHEYKTSWSDLDVDMLREINNKLFKYIDYIAFRGVCKSWRAAGHVKKAGDVLPWFITFEVNKKNNTISYNMYEPEFISTPDDDKSSSSSSAASAKISGSILLNNYFSMQRLSAPSPVRYVDGWLLITVFDLLQSSTSYFLLYSLAAPKTSSFTLPPFSRSSGYVFLNLSTTTPDSPDCVFLTLWSHPIGPTTINIGILRHGDTHWTTTTYSVTPCFGMHINMAAAYEVFYFLIDIGIGSYDLATGELKLDHFKNRLYHYGIHSFFGLDGDLILAYYDSCNNLDIRKYNWMNKVWVPLQTLRGRSLYLNSRGFPPYVDDINYYEIASANKIYVRAADPLYPVDQYTLQFYQLLKRPSERGLVRWAGHKSWTWATWVSPPPHVVQMIS